VLIEKYYALSLIFFLCSLVSFENSLNRQMQQCIMQWDTLVFEPLWQKMEEKAKESQETLDFCKELLMNGKLQMDGEYTGGQKKPAATPIAPITPPRNGL